MGHNNLQYENKVMCNYSVLLMKSDKFQNKDASYKMMELAEWGQEVESNQWNRVLDAGLSSH